MDRRKRRRKFLATTLLRALGYSSDDEILKLFYVIQRLKLKDVDNIPPAELTKFVAVQDVKDGEALLIKAFEPLEIERLRQLKKLGVEGIAVINTAEDSSIIRALRKDDAKTEEEALKEIYKRLRPGDPPTVQNARNLLKRMFFDAEKYDLGRVGRHKLNVKLGLETDLERRVLEK